MADKCGRCSKVVYKQEEMKGAGKVWHKACFKCFECKLSLTEKTVVANQGEIYCKQHVPKPKLTTVADSMATVHAMNAPKKASEALGSVHKGAGGGASHYIGAPAGPSGAANPVNPVNSAPPPPAPVDAQPPQQEYQQPPEQQPEYQPEQQQYDQQQPEQPQYDQQQYDQQQYDQQQQPQ